MRPERLRPGRNRPNLELTGQTAREVRRPEWQMEVTIGGPMMRRIYHDAERRAKIRWACLWFALGFLAGAAVWGLVR